jgi:hypothetical protein
MCNVRISIPTIDYLNGTLTGIRWNFTTKVEDLDFPFDLALTSSKYEHIQSKTEKFQENTGHIYPTVNATKTKIVKLNTTKRGTFEI